MRFGWLVAVGLAVAGAGDGTSHEGALLMPVRGSADGAPHRLGMHGLIGTLRARVSAEGIEHVGFTGFVPDGSQDVSEYYVVAGAGDTNAGRAQDRTCHALTDAAIGIYGHADRRVRVLGFVCAPIDETGAPDLARKYETKPLGVAKGESFYDVCTKGRWLAGLQVSVSHGISVGAICAPLAFSVED